MNLIQEFQSAIEIESQKNLQEYEEQIRLPIAEREAKGNAMQNVSVKFDFHLSPPNSYCSPLPAPLGYINTATISCQNNISKFKEGNSVILSNGNFRFEMDIEEDSLKNFILKPNDFNVKNCRIDKTNYPKNNWEINIVYTDIGERLLKATGNLLNYDNTTRQKIESFLNGSTTNSPQNFSKIENRLNDSQNKALLKAINNNNFCIIQGPPGTGKTETISYITKHLIEMGQKVFISAPTHTAINNCLNAISSKIKDCTKVIKIGEKAQNKDIKQNQFISSLTRLSYSNYNGNLKYSQSGIAIGATAYSLCYPATKRLENWEFDVVIIDEASQLSIPLAVSAMSRTTKYIFVGDHKQLDPIIPKGTNNEMFAESIFGRLARMYPNEVNLLNISYRLNEELIKIPNSLSYNNLLLSDSTTILDSLKYNCTYYPQILNSDSHILALHKEFDSQGRSPYEAKLVAKLVADLLENQVELSSIGIMTPYRAQVREIRFEVEKKIGSSVEKLFIDTVDSMQGQERDYIIYSMSNSHPLQSMRRLDFFYSPNRLNVAITRAIKKCIVIANYKIFDIKEEELIDHLEYQNVKLSLDLFKKYYNMSTKIEITEAEQDEW